MIKHIFVPTYILGRYVLIYYYVGKWDANRVGPGWLAIFVLSRPSFDGGPRRLTGLLINGDCS